MSISIKTWINKNNNIDDVMAADVNDAYTEIIKIETEVNTHEALYIAHVDGTSNKHAAQDLTYSGNFTNKANVKAAIDQAKTEIDTIVTNASIDPEVALARQSSVKNIIYTTLDARLEASESDVENTKAPAYSTPVTATAPIISLPSTVVKGQLSVTVGGNTKNQIAPDTWATSLDGWTSECDSIVSNKYRITHTEYADGYRNIDSLLDKSKYYMLTVFGVSNSDTDGSLMALLDFNVANIKTTSALTKTQSTRLGIIIQPSDITGKNVYLYCTHSGSGYTEYYEFFIQEISAAEYAEGLTVLMNRYPYRTMGTKSTFKDGGRGKATGKNLFDVVGSKYSRGQYLDSLGILVPVADAINVLITTYTPIKSSTQYTLKTFDSGDTIGRIVEYDSNYNFICATTVVAIASTFTTQFNTRYIRFHVLSADAIQQIQLELGSTATPYEPYTDTQAFIPPSTNGLTSVGSVKDEVSNVGGKWVKTQRNGVKVLQASDITYMDSTFTNINIATMLTWAGFHSPNRGIITIEGYSELTSWADNVSNIGKFSTIDYDAVNKIYIVFAKGTTLAAAQTALAGKTLSYQLAVPIVTEIEGMGQLMAEPSGMLIWDTAVKFEAKPVAGVITIPSGWANIFSIESVKKITMNPDGSLTYEMVIPSTNSTTTITLPTGYDGTKFYEVIYVYDPSLTTIGDTTSSYPTNIRGELDSIGDMGKQTAKNLNELNDFTVAYLISVETRLTAHSI